MPPWPAAVGSTEDVRNVAQVRAEPVGRPAQQHPGPSGRENFAPCAACHGADGKGNQALVAPNLADKVWLHGWGEDAIADIVNRGKTSVMPAQGGRMSTEQIHLLASYVWSLSQTRRTASR